MLKLEIGNSYSKLSGLSIEQLKALREIMSYKIDNQAAFFSNAWNTKRYLMDKRGSFPSGLLYLAYSFLDKNKLPCEIRDTRRPPAARQGLFKLNLDVQPYPEQQEASRACQRWQRGTVSAVTAAGKTLMMSLVVNALQVKTLIIVPNLGLKEQLRESFLKYFGSLDNITIENIDSPALEKATDYGCLIIDEAHHVAAATYRRLNKKCWNNIYFRYFFTATPFRSRDEEQLLMESVAGQIIYRIGYREAVKQGYVSPIEAYFIEVPAQKTDAYTWSQVYSQLVVNNACRNEIIQKLCLRLAQNHQPTLCLVKEIKHGEILSADGAFRFAKGENEDNKQLFDAFNARQFDVLVATTGVAGEGIDTRPAEWIIIAGLGKSKNQFMQQVGRGLRKNPCKQSTKIIIFKDNSHKFTKRHYAAQLKILREEYDCEPVKLDIE